MAFQKIVILEHWTCPNKTCLRENMTPPAPKGRGIQRKRPQWALNPGISSQWCPLRMMKVNQILAMGMKIEWDRVRMFLMLMKSLTGTIKWWQRSDPFIKGKESKRSSKSNPHLREPKSVITMLKIKIMMKIAQLIGIKEGLETK